MLSFPSNNLLSNGDFHSMTEWFHLLLNDLSQNSRGIHQFGPIRIVDNLNLAIVSQMSELRYTTSSP